MTMAKCIYPITIGNEDGMKNWKVVPCGKCLACRRRRQAGWSFRLHYEMQRSTTAAFITLTYADNNLTYGEEEPTLVKRDCQLFMKRLRKAQLKLTNDKIKYYGVGEYGTKSFRPHYHFIMFNVHPSLLLDVPMGRLWELGHVQVDGCSIESIQYVTKYVTKPLTTVYGKEKEFSLMSKGLGSSFVTDKNKKWYQQQKIPYVVWKGGQKITMPRYIKEKIFDEATLREFGNEALSRITPEELNETKIFQIKQEQLKLKLLYDEKRSTV